MGEIAEKRQEIVPAAASAYPNIASEYQAALKVVDDVILKNYRTIQAGDCSVEQKHAAI